MRTFKDFKHSLKEQIDDGSGVQRIQDQDVEFDIDNIDVDDVLDTEADEFMIDENTIDTIKSIVKDKQAKTVKFQDKKSVKVDMQTANILLKVVDALNDTNKKKFTDMLSKSKPNFMKAVDFAMKSIG
jgi:CMP-2-keto-3-deoxyoctulosonic acid synthetase